MAVPVRTDPTFEVGSPQFLFEGRYLDGRLGPPEYDITPDGERFVMVLLPEEEEPVYLVPIGMPEAP